jgi:PAS domain S-box-containing protein
MSGEVSCRALRPLFRYVNERGISPADLLADFPSGRDLYYTESWIPAALFAAILERASALLGDPDLVAHVGTAAGEPCPFGPISPQAHLAGSPEALLAQASDFLGLLQRDVQVVITHCSAGKAVIEFLPPDGLHPHSYVCTYAHHLLAAIPSLWESRRVQVRETHCAVLPAEVHRSGALHCTVDSEGQVWEISDQGGGPTRSLVGGLAADGTLLLDGTLYGADRCTYEVTWSDPRPSWQRFLTRLNPVPLVGGVLFRQVGQQQQTIRALREEVRDLNRTLEARVLERTEEMRQKARQKALVEQASRRFASILDPEALSQEAVRTLREDFGNFTVAFYLLEGDSLILRALNTGDNTVLQAVGHVAGIPSGPLKHLRSAGRPLMQNDLASQPHPLGLPRLGRARSALTAPLIASDRLLGILDMQSPRADRFDNDDALTLHTLATQVALTLERSQLYREEQRARQRANAMSVLAHVVNTTLELDHVLSLALDQLRRVLPYDAAAIVLLEGNTPTPVASYGFPPQSESLLGALFDVERAGPLSRALRQAEPLLLAESDLPPFPPQLAHFTSWLAVPLTTRGTALGAFLLTARAPRVYGPEELRTAEDLAGQVATAIENARLYDRIRQDRDRLEALYRITRELNADLEISEVLRHILEPAQASVGAAAGSIILVDEAGRATHSIILRPSNEIESVLQEVLTHGAAGWVLRNQQSLLIRDTESDPHWLRLPNETRVTRSAIVVPLLGQGRGIGVLTVTHPHADHFGQDELDLLTSIAGQASSVVQRAYLFAAIRNERARLETVIEGTAEAVIVLDEANNVLRINRSAADLFGLEVAAVVGTPLELALLNPAIEALLRPAGGQGAPRRAEIPLPDGRTFYATLTPIPKVGAVITMQDISYLKEMDRMKSDFVANVSHDLRTPLGAVQGFAEMLELAGPLSDDQTHFVQRILHQVNAMTALVENLLDLAKIEAGVEMEMAPCQLAAVIAESLDQMAGPAAMKPVTLEVQVPDNLPWVWGNGRRLGQVVNNLLDNAIKYTPVNSRVALHVTVEGSDVCVSMSDQGAGIPAADVAHLFEKFYRVHKSERGPRGTGLGLSIAHSIIQAHGGRIWAESQEGQGSTFSFALPLWGGEK